MTTLTSLIIDVRHGERLNLSGPASVELVHKSGNLVRLRIIAPIDVVFDKVCIGEDFHAAQGQASGCGAHSQA
jgi:hypothetical protein